MRLAEDGYDVAINDLESNNGNLDAVKKAIHCQRPGAQSAHHTWKYRNRGESQRIGWKCGKKFGKLNVVSYHPLISDTFSESLPRSLFITMPCDAF
jgi:hypothetical protein